MPACWHCKQEFTREHALRIAEGKFPLHYEDWAGWRFSGRFLIAPDRQRITAGRLRGLLFLQEAEARRAKVRAASRNDHTDGSSHRMVALPARELFRGQA